MIRARSYGLSCIFYHFDIEWVECVYNGSVSRGVRSPGLDVLIKQQFLCVYMYCIVEITVTAVRLVV